MPLPLPSLPKGRLARVDSLDEGDRDALRKLLALGVLPGEPIRLHRRWPTIVCTVGRTDLALDEELASRILVREEG